MTEVTSNIFLFVTDFHLDWQAVKNNQYESDPLLVACGISVEKQFMQIAGRVLEPPKVVSACFFAEGLINSLKSLNVTGDKKKITRFLFIVQLKFGRSQDCMPEDGRWTFKNKVEPR